MFVILWLMVFILLDKGEGVYCPHYCHCGVSLGLRHVQCTGQGLISVDLDVPRTVQWLQLSQNSIYELNDYIFKDLGLEHIIDLNLDNNAIQSLGLHAFFGLTNLKYLDLSFNHLYYLPPTLFENNPSLAYLSLHGNPLRHIRATFLVSHSISFLDISNCRLNHIPPTAFSGMPLLSRLNVSMNHIDMIWKNTFENLTRLQELDFSNNQLQCDSFSKDLQSWLQSTDISALGDPCHVKEELSQSNDVMFQKMVVINSVEESESGELFMNMPKECSCNNSNGDVQNNKKENINDEEVSSLKNKKSIHISYNPMFLLISFIIGIIVGVAFSLSFWVCMRWTRARNVGRRIAYNAMPYDGPPPAYSELF